MTLESLGNTRTRLGETGGDPNETGEYKIGLNRTRAETGRE